MGFRQSWEVVGCHMYNLHVLAPVFSGNSVVQVAKEKGISRAQCLAPQKNHSCAREARSWRAYAAYWCKPHRRGQTWRESVQLRRNEEQLSTEAEQLRSKPGELQESTSKSTPIYVVQRGPGSGARQKEKTIRNREAE